MNRKNYAKVLGKLAELGSGRPVRLIWGGDGSVLDLLLKRASPVPRPYNRVSDRIDRALRKFAYEATESFR